MVSESCKHPIGDRSVQCNSCVKQDFDKLYYRIEKLLLESQEKDAKIADLENEITALKKLLNLVTKVVGKLHEALTESKSAGGEGE